MLLIGELLSDALRGAVFVTGLVVVMMMMIESFNISTSGKVFGGLRGSRAGQVLLSAFLGSIPGCMGGFASVSLYTHGMISFGALVAMMIASSGDEAFVMLAMIPDKAWWIFLLLFVVAVCTGFLVDALRVRSGHQLDAATCADGLEIHSEDEHHHAHRHENKQPDGSSPDMESVSCNAADAPRPARHFSWKRLVMFLGVAAFIAALAAGLLEHEHEHGGGEAAELVICDDHDSEAHECGAAAHGSGTHECVTGSHWGHECEVESHGAAHHGGINLLSEDWMNIMFAVLSLVVLCVIVWGSDHFVNEHLWHHVVCRHLPRIFAWTFGVLIVIELLTEVFDVAGWISSNTLLMILLATAIGIIPESGPHLIFVTLYATGVVPLPVILASCISQDGHASLPLLAESKRDFLKAKAINCAVALLVGLSVWLLM